MISEKKCELNSLTKKQQQVFLVTKSILYNSLTENNRTFFRSLSFSLLLLLLFLLSNVPRENPRMPILHIFNPVCYLFNGKSFFHRHFFFFFDFVLFIRIPGWPVTLYVYRYAMYHAQCTYIIDTFQTFSIY